MNVEGEVVDKKALEDLMATYAKKGDGPNKLEGANADGISSNPVVFSSGPEVSSQAFLAMFQLMVSKMMYRVVTELETPGHPARRIWVQAPVDEGITAPIEEDRQDDGLPDPGDFARAYTDYKLYLYTYPDGGDCRFELRRGGEGRVPVSEAALGMEKLLKGGWDDAVYTTAREKLAASILTRQGKGEEAKDGAEICPMKDASSDGDYAPWAAVFLAIDAIDLANNRKNRGDRPKLFTTFRFTDALGLYK